jgi:hypothetical protein
MVSFEIFVRLIKKKWGCFFYRPLLGIQESLRFDQKVSIHRKKMKEYVLEYEMGTRILIRN